MYARIARFEGGDPAQIDRMVEASRQMIDAGTPPEGLESSTGVWMLVDRKTGTGLGITLFETEDDLRRGDAALNAMTPPVLEGTGRRTSVEIYEVALRREMTKV